MTSSSLSKDESLQGLKHLLHTPLSAFCEPGTEVDTFIRLNWTDPDGKPGALRTRAVSVNIDGTVMQLFPVLKIKGGP